MPIKATVLEVDNELIQLSVRQGKGYLVFYTDNVSELSELKPGDSIVLNSFIQDNFMSLRFNDTVIITTDNEELKSIGE